MPNVGLWPLTTWSYHLLCRLVHTYTYTIVTFWFMILYIRFRRILVKKSHFIMKSKCCGKYKSNFWKQKNSLPFPSLSLSITHTHTHIHIFVDWSMSLLNKIPKSGKRKRKIKKRSATNKNKQTKVKVGKKTEKFSCSLEFISFRATSIFFLSLLFFGNFYRGGRRGGGPFGHCIRIYKASTCSSSWWIIHHNRRTKNVWLKKWKRTKTFIIYSLISYAKLINKHNNGNTVIHPSPSSSTATSTATPTTQRPDHEAPPPNGPIATSGSCGRGNGNGDGVDDGDGKLTVSFSSFLRYVDTYNHCLEHKMTRIKTFMSHLILITNPPVHTLFPYVLPLTQTLILSQARSQTHTHTLTLTIFYLETMFRSCYSRPAKGPLVVTFSQWALRKNILHHKQVEIIAFVFNSLLLLQLTTKQSACAWSNELGLKASRETLK